MNSKKKWSLNIVSDASASVITRRDSVTPLEWNTIRMNMVQNQLKKTNPEVFFLKIFFCYTEFNFCQL